MTSKIEEYKDIKNKFCKSKEWFELIGKPYNGGGGGIGKLHSVTLDSRNPPTIYHQAYNGATNYHYMPDVMKPYVEQIIKNNFKELFEKAFKLFEQDVSNKAEEAKREYESISSDIL